MSTFLELKNRAILLVDDSDMDDIIPALINQGVTEIAGGMLSTLGTFITPPLPKLFTIGTVDTVIDAAFVPMPDNFHRDLQFVIKSSGSEIDIEHDFIEFTETDPLMTRSGAVTSVIEHGDKLYYLNIPTVAETLTLHYSRRPADMVNEDDLPDGIPIHLQMSLLVNYACWKAYELIEDGLEGDTPNTLKYREFFMTALRALELTIPYTTRGLELM